jgi:hypothetical protein
MSALLLTLLSAALPGADTIVHADRGDVLVIEHLVGRLEVRTWNRDGVELTVQDARAAERRRSGVVMRREGNRVGIRSTGRWEGSGVNRRYEVRVPSWIPVEVLGAELDVHVQGVLAGVSVNTADGDVSLRDVEGAVTVNAIDGSVSVVNASGAIVVNATDDDVRIVESRGTVLANSIDGDVHLISVDMESATATTIDGDVSYSGRISGSGHYRLSTHDGDVSFAVPPGAGADVNVYVGDGRFTSDFRASVRQVSGGQSYALTIGEGGAAVRLDAFDGDVRIRTWNPQ